jgi:hypothetical protein
MASLISSSQTSEGASSSNSSQTSSAIDLEPTATAPSFGPQVQNPAPSLIIKPTKKATITEMKADLAKQGLDTRGKKETLWRSASVSTRITIFVIDSIQSSDDRFHATHDRHLTAHTFESSKSSRYIASAQKRFLAWRGTEMGCFPMF